MILTSQFFEHLISTSRKHCIRLIKTKKHPVRLTNEHGLCREMNHLEGGLFVKRHPVMVDPLFMAPSAFGVFGVPGIGLLASGTALDVHVAGRQKRVQMLTPDVLRPTAGYPHDTISLSPDLTPTIEPTTQDCRLDAACRAVSERAMGSLFPNM